MTQYLYPQNLKATANLWLWGLRDFCILGIAALLSIVALVQLGFFIPAAATLCYGFLTIRMDDTTVLDFIRYAVRYFISTQQYFEYCRVSTKQEEQLNSYETQVRYYTDRINRESGWKLAGIYADKGITGTSMKKRDEFNKLIRQCRRGKVDMIIVKSISRFARNTLDCIRITRMLREIKVDVYFEEQNLHSIDPATEFYISIYGSIAQSESENISHNVAWGKARSAKDGNVFFAYKSFLGYRRGEDGRPEIDSEQAVTVRLIYDWFLSGKSLPQIAKELTESGIPTPMGRTVWQPSVVQSILSNEKYKGDALLGKTYIVDCISKKKCVNAGERVQYYVENNHPAIIDAATFDRVQEELARRAGKRKVKQVGTTTEQGKYCGKYALTELLVCGECGTPYRRCTWTVRGEKKSYGGVSAAWTTERNTATILPQWKKPPCRRLS